MNSKTIILIILLIAIASSIYYLEGTKVIPSGIDLEPVSSDALNKNIGKDEIIANNINKNNIEKKAKHYKKAPELAGIEGYLNTEENIKISDFTSKGKVVLIDFWTYTCINCIRTLPYLVEWDQKYGNKGLVIIGVHTPEFEFEKKYENVKMAIEKYGIKYRVVQDNNYATWRAFKNSYWPRKYLIDSDGFIRYDHIGEGAYEETELFIQELLKEAGQQIKDTETSKLQDKTPRLKQSPELYAGFSFALPRGQNIGNKEGLQPGIILDYKLPEKTTNDVIYLEGKWQSNEDHLQAKESNNSIILEFTASSVNIVANTISKPVKLEVFVNEEHANKEQAGADVKIENGKSFVIVNEPRLYNVFNGQYGNYLLKLTADSSDFNFNAFTFG